MSNAPKNDVATLVRTHARGLRRFFTTSGIAHTEADDLIQSTFEVLLQKDLSAIDDVERYLWGIAHNKLRQTKSRLRTYVEFHSSQIAGSTTALSSKVERQLRFAVLLGRLSDDTRSIFLMRCEGLTIDQIAAAVASSPATVKRRLADARHEIAALVAEAATPEEPLSTDDVEDSYRSS